MTRFRSQDGGEGEEEKGKDYSLRELKEKAKVGMEPESMNKRLQAARAMVGPADAVLLRKRWCRLSSTCAHNFYDSIVECSVIACLSWEGEGGTRDREGGRKARDHEGHY